MGRAEVQSGFAAQPAHVVKVRGSVGPKQQHLPLLPSALLTSAPSHHLTAALSKLLALLGIFSFWKDS